MRAYPELAKGFLYSVAVVFLLWPPFLLGMSRATGEEEDPIEEENPTRIWRSNDRHE
jgi:hypothetical protein